jgi:hypothetical protein
VIVCQRSDSQMAATVHALSVTPTTENVIVDTVDTSSPLPVLERRAVTVKHRVQCKQDQVISWLQDFYTEPGNLEKLLPILQGSSQISLRLVDYFVTNYSKKSNTSYMLSGKHFLVYFNYKRELNAYSKRLFDPFCRRERIMFQARGIEPFVTTVGQLNFFRWFIEKEIYNYVLEHHEGIEKDMNSTLKQHYSRSNTTASSKDTDSTYTAKVQSASTTLSSTDETLSNASSSRKKRCELTQSAMKKVNVHECDVVVHFS